MEKTICKKCGKVIEGYTEKHVLFLLSQHMMKHTREEEQLKKLMEEKENDLKS